MDPWNTMKLVDVNGMVHEINCYHISMMLLAGWICFLLSFILNIVYYAIHPSGVDFNKERFDKRFYFHLCGTEIGMCGPKVSQMKDVVQEKENLAKRKDNSSHVIDIEMENLIKEIKE